jgi:hypothetical protein
VSRLPYFSPSNFVGFRDKLEGTEAGREGADLSVLRLSFANWLGLRATNFGA